MWKCWNTEKSGLLWLQLVDFYSYSPPINATVLGPVGCFFWGRSVLMPSCYRSTIWRLSELKVCRFGWAPVFGAWLRHVASVSFIFYHNVLPSFQNISLKVPSECSFPGCFHSVFQYYPYCSLGNEKECP